MRKVVKEYEVLTFNELNEDAKRYAIDKFNEGRDLQPEGEMLLKDFQFQLDEKGYEDFEVEFSLTYSQGDGVAFYGVIDYSEIGKVAKRLLDEDDYKIFEKYEDEIEIIVNVDRVPGLSNHYSHYNTMSVSLDCNYEDEVAEMLGVADEDDFWELDEYSDEVIKVENMLDTLEKAIADEVVDLSKEFENQGYKYFEELTSDESVIEILSEELNGSPLHEFDKYGNMEF